MEKVLKFYKLVGGEEREFPNETEQLATSDFTYSAKRMAGAPTVTCSIKYPIPLDKLWDEGVYAWFNGEKYYIGKTPSVTKDNTDARYKYDIELTSERRVLENVYFINVVDGSDKDFKGVSNDTKFTFMGDIHEFVSRLNYSLQYAKLQEVDENGNYTSGYRVVVDEDINSEHKDVSFEDQFIATALQEIYNQFELPYYFDGKTIHVGANDASKAIEGYFEYGVNNNLISISKQNANTRIVNRISGRGSSDNIPYYYPNDTAKGQISLLPSQDSELLKKEHFSITDGDKLNARTELDSTVTFTKFEQNKLQSVTLYYYGEYTGDTPQQAVLGWKAFQNDCLPIETVTTSKPRKRVCKYHVFIKGETSTNKGGVLRFHWISHPNYADIPTQIKRVGAIEYGFLDDLVAYEVIGDGSRVNWEASIVGDYRSKIIDIPFQGYNNAEGKCVVEIHLEFSMWKHGDRCAFIDIDSTNFRNITLETSSNKDFYQWVGSRFSSSNIDDFGVELSVDIQKEIDDNPEDYVGEGFFVRQDGYIAPVGNLMPSIYRASNGATRFYNALNDTYEVPDSDGLFYVFENPYVDGNPKEHIESFEDIKPTITDMGNSDGKPMNRFLAFAYDENDNDEMDEAKEEYLHPYFFAKLPKFSATKDDADYGFNLFTHQLESGAMTISMTNGHCGACNFEIAVDEKTQKNRVQIDKNGNLCRDEYGRVVFGPPQEEQNDTRTNEVWVALRKDSQTYAALMPNEGDGNKPTAEKDEFVIVNILFPKEYILDAEKRLDEALIKFMSENNVEKFIFSVKFSRIYLAEHEEVRNKLSENSTLSIKHNGDEFPLYVSSFNYKMEAQGVLPEISVELTDTLSIQTNAIARTVNEARDTVLKTVNSIDYLQQGRKFFLRKDANDEGVGHINFVNGFSSEAEASFGGFKSETQGAGIYQDGSGQWHIEADYFRARKKLSATTVEIENVHHVGGHQLLTAASARVDYVRAIEDETGNIICYRCYFLKSDADGNNIQNTWKTQDQAYCKYFNLDGNDMNERYYWRKVIATSNDTSEDLVTIEFPDAIIITANYHFVDLSNIEGEYDKDSDIPYALDTIVQLGYQGDDDPSRMNAIVIAGAGEGSPYIRQYVGINSFTLPEPDTQIKPDENILSGKTKFKTYDKETGEETGESTLGEIGQNLEVGVSNLLRNSGFTGDYETADLTGGTSLKDAFSTFSPSLEHWEHSLATAQESDFSQSGKEVSIASYGGISQTILHNVRVGEDYIFSFYGKGGQILVSFGRESITIEMTDEWKRYSKKVRPTYEDNIFTLRANDNATLCDIMLEKGNVLSEWTLSPLDNRSELAKYETLTYLQNILRADTEIDGGVISTGVVNTGLINMGHYDEEGKISKVTAGISGTYNNDDSVAFFGGGDLAKAIYTVQKYKENPNYEPTTEELASMAKAVITHGGRAILQDIILRGYVYAEGGVFRGTVYANDGEFNGTVYATAGEFSGVLKAQLSYYPTTIITENDYNIDMQQAPCSYYVYKREVSLNNDTNTYVYLPSAEEYEGLELTFNILDQGVGVMYHYLVAIEEEQIEIPLNATTVKAANDEWVTIECLPLEKVTKRMVAMVGRGEYAIRAIDGKWYATKGVWTGE